MRAKGIFPGRRDLFFRELAALKNNQMDFTPLPAHRLFIKTLGDYFIASILFIMTFPLWLLIMIWIKLDTPGPVLFRQHRAGLKGKPFVIYKFRSMYREVQPEAPTPLTPQDLRITTVGRIIRRFGLDELPQLINVLKGEMSMVGPRPEMLFIVKGYNAIEKKRLLVKPGITGLWQIIGRKDKPIHDDLALDMFYIKKYSFSWDLFILFETLPSVVMSRIIW